MRTSLTVNEIKQLADITQMIHYIREAFNRTWHKDTLTTVDEQFRIKSGLTNLEKAIASMHERLDTPTLLKYMYQIKNSSISSLPTKEMMQKMDDICKKDDDWVVIEYAGVNCNPCREDPLTCRLRLYMDEHKYPAVWDCNDTIRNEEEQKLYEHCKYCLDK
jgi:hypothetical protein